MPAALARCGVIVALTLLTGLVERTGVTLMVLPALFIVIPGDTLSAAAGELLLPTSGAAGFFSRAAAAAAIVPVLWATGFLQPRERRAIKALWSRLFKSGAVREPA